MFAFPEVNPLNQIIQIGFNNNKRTNHLLTSYLYLSSSSCYQKGQYMCQCRFKHSQKAATSSIQYTSVCLYETHDIFLGKQIPVRKRISRENKEKIMNLPPRNAPHYRRWWYFVIYVLRGPILCPVRTCTCVYFLSNSWMNLKLHTYIT